MPNIYTNSHALLIGVNKYPHLTGNDLECAENDIQKMREVLEEFYGFPASNIKSLLDEQATRTDIEDALSDLADRRHIRPADRILIYFSGHGQTVSAEGGDPQGFLLPHNAKVDLADTDNPQQYIRTCVALSRFWKILDLSPAKHILIMADACFSGLLTERSRRTERLVNPENITHYLERKARQIIAASKKDKPAWEAKRWGHGAFTYCLLEQLRKRAETSEAIFTASDLYASVQERLMELTKGDQMPCMDKRRTQGETLFNVVRHEAIVSVCAERLPTTGRLVISSEPTGATVAIDSILRGTTPAEIEVEIEHGDSLQVDFTIRLAGYRLERRRITALLGKTVRVETIQLEPLPPCVEVKELTREKTTVTETESIQKFVAGSEMLWIPAGSFDMGTPPNEIARLKKAYPSWTWEDEGLVHRVELNGFYMSKNVVTAAQYEAYCKAKNQEMPPEPEYPSGSKFNAGWSKKDHPIVNVSWKDAKGYCDWAGVDLPTEAEWEYAARGGLAGKQYPWGDTWDGSKCANNLKGTAKVGSYPANDYGLCDMAGNVWEWCLDWYNAGYYAKSPTKNPQDSDTATKRILRGGSWTTTIPELFRCAFRLDLYPDFRLNNFGFRVVFRGHP